MDDAVRCLVDQASVGKDTLIGAPPGAAERLLAEAAAALSGHANVISVNSAGELGLSSLIAQLSGQTDVGGQDDAVLELGFKRLTSAGRTILMLLAPQGISRSALRYLQHVSRQAPQLTLVVLDSPPLHALLEEPGFAAMRTRLTAAAPIEAPPPAASARRSIVPAVATAAIPIDPPISSSRRLLWVASALGIAAAIGGLAWLGQNSLRAQEEGSRQTKPTAPAMAALVSAPPLASASAAPAATSPIPPTLAAVTRPSPALPPRIPIASTAAPVLALLPPPLLAAKVPIPAAQVVVDRLPPLRRPEPAKAARLRHTWPEPRHTYQEPAGYAEEPDFYDPPPPWFRREFRRRDRFYPYAVDIYGRPIFGEDR